MMLLKSNDQTSHTTYLSFISLLGFVFLDVLDRLHLIYIRISRGAWLFQQQSNKRRFYYKEKRKTKALFFFVWLFLFKHNFKRRAAWKYKLSFVSFVIQMFLFFHVVLLCLELIEWSHHTNSALSSFSIFVCTFISEKSCCIYSERKTIAQSSQAF